MITQRLDQDGKPLAAQQTLPGVSRPLFLTSNGTNYLLLAEDSEDYTRSRAMLLDHDGALVRTFWNYQQKVVAAGIHGGNYVVVDVATDSANAKPTLRTISDTGAVRGTFLPECAAQVAAFSPDGIFLAWRTENNELEFLLAGYDGQLIRGPSIIDRKILQYSGPFTAYWNGSEFEVTYRRGTSDVSIARITAGGTVVDGTPFVLTPNGYTHPLSFASGDGVQIILWEERGLSPANVSNPQPSSYIMARTFTSFDSILTAPDRGNLISWSGIAQADVRVARAGEHEIAVWSDRSDRIFASVDGVPVSINGTPALIGPRQMGGYVDLPAVGSSNSHFLVVWRDGTSQMLAERVGFDGRVLDNPPIVLSANTGVLSDPGAYFSKSPASIASDGSSYLVSWSRPPFVGAGGLTSALVTSDGTIRSLAELSVGDMYRPYAPRALWAGSNYFVGYSLKYVGYCSPVCSSEEASGIGGSAVDTAGRTSLPKQPFLSSGGLPPNYKPVGIAYGAGRVTFVWGLTYRSGLALQQTTTGGVVLSAPHLLLDSSRECELYPTVGWDGAAFVAAWIDECDAAVRAVRLNQFGDPIEPPFDVATDVSLWRPDFETDFLASPVLYGPSIVPTPDGVVIIYSRGDPANGDMPRAFERSLARLQPALPRQRAVASSFAPTFPP